MPTTQQPDVPPLTADQARAFMDHLARYRLTIFSVARKIWSPVAKRPRVVKRWLRALQEKGLVTTGWLHPGLRAWYLTAAGAQRCGVDPKLAQPFSSLAEIRAYALLRFCYLSEVPRHRLLPADIARNLPDVQRPGMPTGYYYSPSQQGRLGLARIDAGHQGRWDRIVESVREDIRDHWRQPKFRALMQSQQMELTLITVLPQKAERLQAALQEHADARRMLTRVVAMPELLPLLVSKPRKEGTRRHRTQ